MCCVRYYNKNVIRGHKWHSMSQFSFTCTTLMLLLNKDKTKVHISPEEMSLVEQWPSSISFLDLWFCEWICSPSTRTRWHLMLLSSQYSTSLKISASNYVRGKERRDSLRSKQTCIISNHGVLDSLTHSPIVCIVQICFCRASNVGKNVIWCSYSITSGWLTDDATNWSISVGSLL